MRHRTVLQCDELYTRFPDGAEHTPPDDLCWGAFAAPDNGAAIDVLDKRPASKTFRWPPMRCGKAIDQCQPVQAFLEASCEIVLPTLGTQPSPLPNLLHRHAEDQNFVDQHRTVGPELVLGTLQPQDRLTLAFRDRLAPLAAIDIFARRIDSTRPALGLFPIALEGAASPILRIVDLAVRMQPTERIVADRAQRDNPFAPLKRERIVDFDRRHLGIVGQVLGAAVVPARRIVRFPAFGSRH